MGVIVMYIGIARIEFDTAFEFSLSSRKVPVVMHFGERQGPMRLGNALVLLDGECRVLLNVAPTFLRRQRPEKCEKEIHASHVRVGRSIVRIELYRLIVVINAFCPLSAVRVR